MHTPESDSLLLFDQTGAPFGAIRIAPDTRRDDRWDCIFDVEATDEHQDARSEVRWLVKRHFRRWSEHRLTFTEDGAIEIRKNDFHLKLEPLDGGGFGTFPPLPTITAKWG